MIAISSATENLAKRLLAGDPTGAGASNGVDPAIIACDKLRVPLTRLAGAAGFFSLLSRALAVAKRRSPSLANVRVDADGLLVVVDENDQRLDGAKISEQGGVILITELLALLVALIGEPLTLGLVRERWPEAPVEKSNPNTQERP